MRYQDEPRLPGRRQTARWQCTGCGARIDDETLREAFVKAYNAVALERERMIDGWESTLQKRLTAGKNSSQADD